VLVVLALVVAAAAARPVVHAVEVALEVVLITAASLAGLAVAGAVAYVALRARSRRTIRTTAVSFHAPIVRPAAQAVSEPRPRVIETKRLSLDDLAALLDAHGYDVIRRGQEES
jgi:hypothetical protein